ncbi:MAG: bifunctional demethylmenaquinone methyltransferase/2-methoxy-6-polyprenyl-1,4-benzoquinol methylase UbiE [Phycisphaerae bacterium]|nr:bifunctional demethylmenaquinone methyltransferase/2-methoxy-6-polyprenyl-1,4-benzoquinol methylase UbiE [Phycisphaerae bacterium]
MARPPVHPEASRPREPRDPSEAAWSEQLLTANPHERDDKAVRVRSMFGAIARRYDLNNRLHSFGLDQRWRRRTVQLASVNDATEVVDVACGTGDLTEAFAAAGVRSVIGVDFTPQMLHIARVKSGRRRSTARNSVAYREGDATQLDLPDASCDVVSIAFGIRNVSEPAKALREFRRILRPNGRLVVLEFSEPRNALLRLGNRIYCHHIMPLTATLIARDRSGAYRYLPRSVETFLTPAALAAMAREAGFSDVTQHPLTFGVCTVTVAR